MINKLLRGSMMTAGAIAAASTPANAAPADFSTKADAYLKTVYPADAPGVAVIVVDDGKVVYSGGRGLANIEAKQAITPSTVFRLGSITKQFTAAVVLQLVQEGKLSLSDPLSKFLPDYPKPGADATIAQLLNHTSGIKSYTGIPGWMMVEANTARPYTTDEMIALFKDQPADFAVGSDHKYNNSGYVLLGAVIEKVTGKPWHAAVDERIVKPLGLKTIRYGELEATTPNMAVGYSQKDGKFSPARKIHMSVPHAAGALIGSVEDLAKWAEALHKGKVVSSATYAQMIAPTKLPNGKTENYGYGLAQRELRDLPSIGHGGGIFGFDTSSVYVPSEDVFIAVFANSDDPVVEPDIVALKLGAMAVGKPFPDFEKASVAPSEIEPLLGLYQFEGGTRRFFAKDGRLFTRRSGGNDMEVWAAGKDRFFYGPANFTWFAVKRDTAGKHVMEMHQSGSEEALKSVRAGPVPVDAPAVTLSRDVLDRYVGSYKASQGFAKVAVAEDGGLTIQLGGGNPIKLHATSETEFRAEGRDGKVVFHGEAGKVSHIILHEGDQQIRGDRQPG